MLQVVTWRIGLAAKTGSTDTFYVFKGSASGGGIVPALYPVLAVVQMLWAITTDSVLTFEATMMRTRLRRIAWAILMAQIAALSDSREHCFKQSRV